MTAADTAGWGDAEWAGYARQAEARRQSGMVLDECDEEALRRFPNPPMCGEADYGRESDR